MKKKKTRLVATALLGAVAIGLAMTGIEISERAPIVWLNLDFKPRTITYLDGPNWLVVNDEEWNAKVIDPATGKTAVDYDYVSSYTEGLMYEVRKDGKYGLIDKTGRVVVPVEYDFVADYDNGLWRLEKDQKYGIVNMNGRFILPVEYDRISYPFSEGLVCVLKDGQYEFVDQTGQVVISLDLSSEGEEYEFIDVSDFSEGLAKVEKGGKSGFIDRTGQFAIPLELEYWVSDFSEGLAKVEKDGKWGFIDRSGQVVIPVELEYDWVRDFSDGVAEVEKDDKYGLIDTTGQVIVPAEYDSIYDFSEGLAAVEKDGKWGFIDRTGQIVIPLEYENAWSFSYGVSVVEKDGKVGLINTSGRFILPPAEYSSVIRDGERITLIQEDGTRQVFSEGKPVTATDDTYDTDDAVAEPSKRLTPIEKDGKYGFRDGSGETVVPARYDDVGGVIDDLDVRRYYWVRQGSQYGVVENPAYRQSDEMPKASVACLMAAAAIGVLAVLVLRRKTPVPAGSSAAQTLKPAPQTQTRTRTPEPRPAGEPRIYYTLAPYPPAIDEDEERRDPET